MAAATGVLTSSRSATSPKRRVATVWHSSYPAKPAHSEGGTLAFGRRSEHSCQLMQLGLFRRCSSARQHRRPDQGRKRSTPFWNFLYDHGSAIARPDERFSGDPLALSLGYGARCRGMRHRGAQFFAPRALPGFARRSVTDKLHDDVDLRQCQRVAAALQAWFMQAKGGVTSRVSRWTA